MAEEFEVMKAIGELMPTLEDDSARSRVLTWAFAKFGSNVPIPVAAPTARPAAPSLTMDTSPNGEIAGIAKLGSGGEILWTIRDVKAKSANDAAIRLVHVAVWTALKLAGAESISSKRVLVPLLRKYRAYDGNTRGALARQRGIVRAGDAVSLDFHAMQEAERYASEILDPNLEGRWKSGATKRRLPVRGGQEDLND